MGRRVGDGGEAGTGLGVIMMQGESLKPSGSLPRDSSSLADLPGFPLLSPPFILHTAMREILTHRDQTRSPLPTTCIQVTPSRSVVALTPSCPPSAVSHHPPLLLHGLHPRGAGFLAITLKPSLFIYTCPFLCLECSPPKIFHGSLLLPLRSLLQSHTLSGGRLQMSSTTSLCP